MKNHLLASYFHAILSVALAQFSSRGFEDGMPGIVRLAETSPYVQVSPLSSLAYMCCVDLDQSLSSCLFN